MKEDQARRVADQAVKETGMTAAQAREATPGVWVVDIVKARGPLQVTLATMDDVVAEFGG